MDVCDSNGRTGLFHTISSGANLVDLLLNEGAEIEWIDKSGETALINLNVKSIKYFVHGVVISMLKTIKEAQRIT